MKPKSLASIAVLAVIITSGCSRKSDEATARKVAELERERAEAVERSRQLEQENKEQRLAAERDAIERERMLIEEERAKLEQQKSDEAALAADKLRERELSLTAREGKAEQLQSALEEQQDDLERRGAELSDRDRELAGREALVTDAEDDVQEPVGDYGMFYESLSSYGSWFESPDYGYVWQPVVVRDAGWRPYTRGRWACSDHGWIWVSDEPFGWACYHYGRWCLLRDRGWVWVPGSEWAPAWVTWRSGGSHVGWAPLPPETLAYHGHHWDASVETSFHIGALWFNFVETRHFGRPIHHHCLPYTQNNLYINQSVNITNIHVDHNRVICGGPRYRDFNNHEVPFYHLDLDRHRRPGRDMISMASSIRGDHLRIPAPHMNVDWNDGLKPSRIRGRLDNVVVERPEALRPEITDMFRRERDRRRSDAEQTITRLGGVESLNKHRMDQFEKNSRDLEARSQQNQAAREAVDNARKRGRVPDGPKQDDRNLRDRLAGGQAQRKEEESRRGENETGHRGLTAREAEENARKRDITPDDSVARDRGLRDRQTQDETRRNQAEENRRTELDTSRRQQQEAARREQMERAKEQQEVARRGEQQEAARREQMERAKEQQEVARRGEQQEAARREQMERAKEQQEAARREQQEAARREQMERAREQQEAARREQQEAARREQMERAREQQESARREQMERAREQQEAARREQQERAREEQQREQQERSRQDQRGGRGGFR